MPTIEERLAALETKLDALTETTPTTYYEHQYSGEEIDNAVSRALPNGAIDQSVGTFVRPNLLDNWYFGRPVDQRGGMLQLAGTMLYSDAACTQAMFPSTKTTSIIKVSDIAAHPSDDSTVYVKMANCVRGYTGNGYSVDRWFFDTDSGSCSLTLTNDGLKFIATASATGIASLKQDIDPTMLSALAGKTVTLSLLGKTDITQQVLFYVNSKVAAVNFSQAVNGVCMTTLTYTFPEVLTGAAIFVYGRTHSGAGEGTILAAKLELGPTQTLAHQENGVWVINEVPEYGEQLRRCKWYSNVLPGIYWLPQNADGTNRLTIPIPDMRTIPAVTYEPADGSTGTLYYDANLAQKNSIQFYATGVTGICGVKNIRISADL